MPTLASSFVAIWGDVEVMATISKIQNRLEKQILRHNVDR